MAEAAALVDARAMLGMRDDGQRHELVEGALRMMSPAGERLDACDLVPGLTIAVAELFQR